MREKFFFLGRQPILNRDRQIVAYELLFRNADTHAANIRDKEMASSDVIFKTLTTFGVRELLGNHKGFINFSYESLMTNFVELLPSEQIVIELMEDITVGDELIARCREIKERGFKLSLDNHVYDPEFAPLYEIVDLVKIDILATHGLALQLAVKKLRKWPLTLLAEKIETADQYDQCLRLGFDLFQGYYIAIPVVMAHKQIDMSRIALIKLFNKLTDRAELDEIEEIFKLNPVLIYHLLRLVNSVALGLKVRICSLRHAIMILGTQQLKVWVLLAMMISTESANNSHLLELAVMRGRLLELLIQRMPFPAEAKSVECAFLTGALSVLHLVVEKSMKDFVDHLRLNEEMREALLMRKGPLGELLLLVEAAEKGDCKNTMGIAEQLGLTVDDISTAQIETIKWSNALMAG